MKYRRGFLRNFVFGAEDGLVSTVGLLAGVSFAGLGSRYIIVSGIILILVEALSMAAGAYISEDSSVDIITDGKKNSNLIYDSVVMFFSYLLIGLIPLLPYIFIGDTRVAFYWSLGSTLLALFSLGLFKGYFLGKPLLLNAFKIAGIGSVVVGIAVVVGLLLA